MAKGMRIRETSEAKDILEVKQPSLGGTGVSYQQEIDTPFDKAYILLLDSSNFQTFQEL